MSRIFLPSQHGFPFPNHWPDGKPVLELPTPFGRFPIGNAAAGVCGGMVFAALDYYHHQIPVPCEPNDELFRYFVRRLFASWNIPLGGYRYFDWQRRPNLHRHTERQWMLIRSHLDGGTPAPLGIVKVHSWDPRQVGRNHQVLATSYETADDGSVELQIYDPNYPGDDTVSLQWNPTVSGSRIRHTWEGESVRGFFLTRYRTPDWVPRFG